MSLINKLYKYITNERYRVEINQKKGFYNHLPDEEFLKLKFKLRMGEELDLVHPETFNQKLQWLKLNDHNPKYTAMVDKYDCKRYVGEIIGEQFIISTFGIWDSFENIDFDLLPDQFVLKCTHDSGGNVICKNKRMLNMKQAREKINKSLKKNYYYVGREWPYKDVKPRIIAEEYLENDSDSKNSLIDYKVHCFNGEPKVILVCKDRFTESGMTEDFFSCEWEHLLIKRSDHDNSHEMIEKPSQLPEMIELSKKLSSEIPFLRVDWYICHGELRFGELTFFPTSGFKRFVPDSADKWLGDMLDLPTNSKHG